MEIEEYKKSLQYKYDIREFRCLFWYSICMLIFWLAVILIVGYLISKIDGQSVINFFIIGAMVYLALFVPFLIYSLYRRRQIKEIMNHLDEMYFFNTKFEEYCQKFFMDYKYRIKFKYKGIQKSLITRWFHISNDLENSIVEVGYIESLDKIIVIRKIEDN